MHIKVYYEVMSILKARIFGVTSEQDRGQPEKNLKVNFFLKIIENLLYWGFLGGGNTMVTTFLSGNL